MNSLTKHILKYCALIASFFLLTGCEWVIFDPKGPIARDESHLILVAVGLMLLVIVPVIIMGIVFPIKYRESNKKSTYAPNWKHSSVVEFLIWGGPIVIIVTLSFIVWETTHKLNPFNPFRPDAKHLEVNVVALDWKWLFIYPEQDIAVINELYLPKGVPVDLSITSQTVMNTFFIPQLAGQIYAMPAMQSKLYLQADELGVYDGHSGNISGAGFSSMHFKVHAVDQNKFDEWVADVKKSKNGLIWSTYLTELKPTPVVKDEDTPRKYPITYFSSVEPGLFEEIIRQVAEGDDDPRDASLLKTQSTKNFAGLEK